MTNTITILAIVLVGFGVQSAYACTEGNIQHWQYMFSSPATGTIFQHDTEPDITEAFNIPIPTMGSELVSQDNVAQKFADRLNQLGYFTDDGPVDTNDFDSVNTLVAGYSTICKDGVMEMVGGMLIQPDATAMFLAYGIANAIWIAPTMAGLAAGIYLTKNKWKR